MATMKASSPLGTLIHRVSWRLAHQLQAHRPVVLGGRAEEPSQKALAVEGLPIQIAQLWLPPLLAMRTPRDRIARPERGRTALRLLQSRALSAKAIHVNLVA